MKSSSERQKKIKQIHAIDKFWREPLGATAIIMGLVVLSSVMFAFASKSDLLKSAEPALFVMFCMIPFLIPVAYLIYREEIIGQEEQFQKKVRFYMACTARGIPTKMDDYYKQKAELIARELKCAYTDIEKYYQESIEAYRENQKQKDEETKQECLNFLQKRELEKYQELTRFVECIGRNKRLSTLQYMQKQYRDTAKSIRKSDDAMMQSLVQREINSGVAAGIAEGLLGGAAGVAAFIDAENKNASIRASNKKNMDMWYAYRKANPSKAYEFDKKADALQGAIDATKIKCVADVPMEQVFSYLSIVKKCVTISPTGAVEIEATVQVKAKTDKLAVGPQPGVIDGTIVADVYQEGKLVASALMMLPTFGVRNTETIKGIAIYAESYKNACADPTKHYQIKFRPYHLWIMEK